MLFYEETQYRTLSGRTYNASGLVDRQTYGTGDYIDYTYDKLDFVTGKQYNRDNI